MDLQKVMQEVVAPRPKVARPIVMIGSGGIVHDAHLPAYKKAGFPVAALVDVNREKAEGLAKTFGIHIHQRRHRKTCLLVSKIGRAHV